MKLSETLNEIIPLADAVHRYWESELPKRHPDYPLVHPGEDDGPPPPEEVKLRALLASLPEDEVYKIALIEHLGPRGLGRSDLTKQYAELKERFETPQWAASWLSENHNLAEDLTDGLAELRKHGIDVDDLTLTPVESGN